MPKINKPSDQLIKNAFDLTKHFVFSSPVKIGRYNMTLFAAIDRKTFALTAVAIEKAQDFIDAGLISEKEVEAVVTSHALLIVQGIVDAHSKAGLVFSPKKKK